jgi:hypothetical protein
MIFEGRENNVRRTGSLTGFVLSASLLARFRLLWNKASVALAARSRVTDVVMIGTGATEVVGVVTGNSNWPPGIVPLRGFGWFQSIGGRCSVAGDNSESEPPSPSEENDMRDSSILSIEFDRGHSDGRRPEAVIYPNDLQGNPD